MNLYVVTLLYIPFFRIQMLLNVLNFLHGSASINLVNISSFVAYLYGILLITELEIDFKRFKQ